MYRVPSCLQTNWIAALHKGILCVLTGHGGVPCPQPNFGIRNTFFRIYSSHSQFPRVAHCFPNEQQKTKLGDSMQPTGNGHGSASHLLCRSGADSQVAAAGVKSSYKGVRQTPAQATGTTTWMSTGWALLLHSVKGS